MTTLPKKGEIRQLAKVLLLQTQNGDVDIPVGTRLKVMRGGKMSKVMMVIPNHEDFRLVNLPAAMVSEMPMAPPLLDHVGLGDIVMSVKRDLSRSEETVARCGTIHLVERPHPLNATVPATP